MDVNVVSLSRAALLSLLWSSTAMAQATPVALSGRYSPYEERALHAAERSLATVREPHPEGKVVEEVVIRRLAPIEPRDPAPTALNVLHVESREANIAREVVLRPGAAFSRVQCDESARRLRALPQLSLVMCVALRSARATHVKVLILTKDVWSLFLDPDFNFEGGNLQLEPKESNLLGLHHVVFLRYKRDPFSHSWGGDYTIPRFDGQFLSLTADANLIVNDKTGQGEGSFGAFQARGVPRSNRDPWSWFSDLNWFEGFERTATGSRVKFSANGYPLEWHHSEFNATAALTRSFGWRYKSDFTLALAGSKAGDYAAAVSHDDRQLMAPHRRFGPVFESHFYTNDFLRTYEVETLGLQEDFRLGHDLRLMLAPALDRAPVSGATGSQRQQLLLGLNAVAQETLALGNGFARAAVLGALDVASDGLQAPFIKAWLHVVSPRLGFGRLVADSELSLVLDESETRAPARYSNANRLRGYDGGQLGGWRVGVVNVEYRTPALQVWTEQLGAVLFYDAGAQPTDDSGLQLLDSVGVGLRVVTPLLERAGLRIDFALPLRHGPGVSYSQFQLAFGQAFGVPDVAPLKPKRLP